MKIDKTAKPAKLTWFNNQFVPSSKAKVHISSVGVNYGAGVYDVMRFREVSEKTAIFRLDDHLYRFYYSAQALRLNLPFEKNDFRNAVIESVRVNEVTEGEIRLFALCGYGRKGLYPPKSEVDAAIVVSPSTDITSRDPFRVKISKFMRPHPSSTVINAKIYGHYGSSIFATIDAHDLGVDSVVQLDWEGNLAEGPIGNFFIVYDDILYTPPKERILTGVTRDTVIKLAEDLKISVNEMLFKPMFLQLAQEAFFSGTSLGIYPITNLEGKELQSRKSDSITMRLREAYFKATHGDFNDECRNWLTFIEGSK
jgi:branched-chain amino acid aminotransferase